MERFKLPAEGPGKSNGGIDMVVVRLTVQQEYGRIYPNSAMFNSSSNR